MIKQLECLMRGLGALLCICGMLGGLWLCYWALSNMPILIPIMLGILGVAWVLGWVIDA